jgi:hypothetical protein
MARKRSLKRSYRRAKAGFTLPLAVVGGFAPLAVHAIDDYRVAGLPHVGKGICVRTTGYMIDTGKFEFGYLKQGLLPIVAGVLVHKLAGKLGVNRAIAAAGIPFVRI